ncbi:MAG: PEP/pyruvate-binding domain-containing protein [Nitrospiraceae bacterium]
MSHPFVLPLGVSSDPTLVGGKAAGLYSLMRNGFSVPQGLCLTTEAYHESFRSAGLDESLLWVRARKAREPERRRVLSEQRQRILSMNLPRVLLDQLAHELDRLEAKSLGSRTAGQTRLWAVRSSGSNEDGADASYAGLFRTVLGVSRDAIPGAILECWASLWTDTVFAYQPVPEPERRVPAMAVILQPLLTPRTAGSAHSRHPITGRPDCVLINAVVGLAEPFVSGLVRPDQFVLEIGDGPESARIVERSTTWKRMACVAGRSGLIDQLVAEHDRNRPALEDHEVLALGALVKQVEQCAGHAVDVEWALDGQDLWLLQARSIPSKQPWCYPSAGTCAWSRANFKETLPELPSPLTLSYVHEFMEHHIIRHYREIGCVIPLGMSATRVVGGRPYLNVTLFQALMAQLGGDPVHVTEQMGGVPEPFPGELPQLSWWKWVRAGIHLQWKVWMAVWRAPARFAMLKSLGNVPSDTERDTLTEQTLLDQLQALRLKADANDLTFAIVTGVSQALYGLDLQLRRRLGEDWRPLLNATIRGLGNIISANQILWLAELSEQARGERLSRDFLLAEPWAPGGFRSHLAGTRVLESLDRYLREYGHRALGESDVIVPRFSETPEYVLGIIRAHMQAGAARSVEHTRRDQDAEREAALARIRNAFGWRWHEWVWFRWCYGSLCRFLALREANRHYLAHYLAGVRRYLLILGQKLAGRGVLERTEDLFFLTQDEVSSVLDDTQREWRRVVAARRTERDVNAAQTAPDLIPPTVICQTSPLSGVSRGEQDVQASRGIKTAREILTGIPLSAGLATGPARLVLDPRDPPKVAQGDILVCSVIDPGMAPLMSLAAGLVAEMGGTLSHGAIIVREYGIPAIANVLNVTRLLRDGDHIAVDATRGEVLRLDTHDR